MLRHIAVTFGFTYAAKRHYNGRVRIPTLHAAILVAWSACLPICAFAGSATWNSNPASDDWNTAANWVPQTVPNGPSDVATFAASEGRVPLLSEGVELAALVFSPGAGTYKITSSDGYGLIISGYGITNNSGLTQHFIAGGGDLTNELNGFMFFKNNATAGTDIHFTAEPGRAEDFGEGGAIEFLDQASADHGFFEVFGAYPEAAESGQILFYDDSTAGDATFLVHTGIHGGYNGELTFFGNATAANSTVINKGGFFYFWDSSKAGNCAVANDGYLVFRDSASADHAIIDNNTAGDASYYFGSVNFWSTATAGDSIITNEGGASRGALGGQTIFPDDSTAGNATLIANPGVNGGMGGSILFSRRSFGGTARVEVFGNGSLDISERDAPGLTIGSLEGDGIVLLNLNDLTIGGNDLSTTFSGVIQGSGSIAKIGQGKLTLSGANPYTGGTTLYQGMLRVSNTSGSATGIGTVQVDGGNLGGTGVIAGETSIGPGTTFPAVLMPSAGGKSPATLTIQSALHFKGGAFNCLIDTRRARADQVIANGVSIENPDNLNAFDTGKHRLAVGQVFVAISNTSGMPISGTFGNLPDGGNLIVGKNKFKANYEGGDGNDLTLTVVP